MADQRTNRWAGEPVRVKIDDFEYLFPTLPAYPYAPDILKLSKKAARIVKDAVDKGEEKVNVLMGFDEDDMETLVKLMIAQVKRGAKMQEEEITDDMAGEFVTGNFTVCWTAFQEAHTMQSEKARIPKRLEVMRNKVKEDAAVRAGTGEAAETPGS